MRTTFCKRSGLGHDINATCYYIGDYSSKSHDLSTLRTRYKNNPHKLAFVNKHCTKRNLALRGIGVPINGWRHTAKAFKRLAKLKPKNSVKTINLVISPSKGSVDPYNIEQVNKFANYCEKFTKRWYPRHLAYLAVQCDNRNKVTHCHIIVSALSTLKPHNEMKSSDYEDHHLQRAFNQSAKRFNKQQNVLELGPAVTGHQNGHKLKPSKTDKWLIQHAKIPLNNLIANKDRNKTAFEKDLRAHGIRLKLRTHRHRKHDANGHVIYRKYKSGQKAGQYIYRKNRHGHRIKIPEYNYVTGAVMSPLNKIEKNRRHNWVHGSRLAELTGNKEFNGRFMISVLHKGHQTAVKSSAATSESASASATAKSKASQASSASTTSQLASNRNSMMNSTWRDSLSSKANQLSAQSANHSLAVQEQFSKAKTNFANAQQSAATYFAQKSTAIQNERPAKDWARNQAQYQTYNDYENRECRKEAKRVTTILPNFSNSLIQCYSDWAYNHLVPFKLTNHGGRVFRLKPKDLSWLKKLINPIVNKFHSIHQRAYNIWKAGCKAIQRYLNKHHISSGDSGSSIITLAKHSKLLGRFTRTRAAKHFHNLWPRIKSLFVRKFVSPAKHFNKKRQNANNKAVADSLQFAYNHESKANSESKAQSAMATSIQNNYESQINSISAANHDWNASFTASTVNYTIGKDNINIDSANSYLASEAARLKSISKNTSEINEIRKILFAPAQKYLNDRNTRIIRQKLHQNQTPVNGQENNQLPYQPTSGYGPNIPL